MRTLVARAKAAFMSATIFLAAGGAVDALEHPVTATATPMGEGRLHVGNDLLGGGWRC
jgi:hypothetical protein